MKKKKLYLISYYFAPLGRADGVNRSYLAKYLAEQGWEIEVVNCANPHALLNSFQKDYSLLDILPSEVTIHPVKSTYWGPVGGILSLLGLADDPFGNWLKPAKEVSESIVDAPGIIYAIVPPVTNAKVAFHIAQQKNLPLILDFRDNNFKVPPNIVQSAATIITTGDRSLEDMQTHYKLSKDNGHIIYNGYPVNRLETSNEKQFSPNRLRIVYTGLLNLGQDPVVLAKAVARMEEKYPDAKGKVFVDYYGPNNFYTKLFLPKYLKENIHFRGYLPFKKVLKEIAQADMGYSSLQYKRNAYISAPSKVFQYISMETPILAVGPNNSALQTFVESNQIGTFSYYHDIEGQAEQIYYLLTHPDVRYEMSQKLKKVKPTFSMKHQVKLLSHILLQTISQ